MLKLLLTLVVVGLGLMFWFGKGRKRSAGRAEAPPPAPQAMVRCAHCGVHLPRQDAFIDDAGRLFCGAEHRHLGPRTGRAA